MRFYVLILTLALRAIASTVQEPGLGTDVDEKACAVKKPAASFKRSDRQIFFAFVAHGVAQGERLRIEWIEPSGAIADSVAYPELPAAPALCFVTQLPVSGFPASSRPGAWSVRILINEERVFDRGFKLEPGDSSGDLSIVNVSRNPAGADRIELQVDGSGFDNLSVIHIAEFSKDGGWRYVRSLLPTTATATRLTVTTAALPTGEYLAIVKNPNDATSQPSRFLIATDSGYHLPFAVGERWVITQTPYGGFSHWRNSLHAFDIAPRSGQWVAAMRPGIVYTHDVGAVQSHTRRTFGNYITIQHDDGEFSHYCHLATGTFLVKNGDRVEAGQPLARVGNSGYTLGEGGGYHVHVHVTKSMAASAQSIPFQFVEFPTLAVTALRNREVTAVTTPTLSTAVIVPKAAPKVSGERKSFAASVAVASTWSDILTVPDRAKALEVTLTWPGAERDIDLHLVSPSGRHFGWYAETEGYSGRATNPERFRLDHPEPGAWRIMAAGMKGTGEAMSFTVESLIVPADPVRSGAPVRRAAR